MNPTITPDGATQAPAQQIDIRAHVAAGSARYAAFLVGLAAASSFYVLALGLFPLTDARAIITLSIGLACWMLVLSLGLLPSAKVQARGFATQWTTVMLTWGTAFGLALGLGLGLNLPEVWFWIMALVVVAPGIIGALVILRGHRG